MRFRIIKNLAQCEALWNRFSPKQALWDIWEANACFYLPRTHKARFITAYKDGEAQGVLPLWYDEQDDTYAFFGGYFPENRRFYTGDIPVKEYLNALEKDEYITLWDVSPQEKDKLPFQEGERRYYLDLTQFDFDIDSYLNTFNKKHRKNLRYDLKKLDETYKPAISINRLQDYPRLVTLNKQRFGKDSDFNDAEQKNGMKKLIEYAQERGMLNMVSIIIGGKVEAIEIAVIYKDTYYVLGGGANLNISNLGKYLNMTHIRQAASKRIPIIDFMTSDSGWKQLWNLKSEQLYNYMNYDKKLRIIPLD